MKAKATVMPWEFAHEIWAKGILLSIEERDYNMLVRQAEITWDTAFKTGIKEVSEWANGTCPHGLGEGTQNFKRVCDLCWQTKLKEWGV